MLAPFIDVQTTNTAQTLRPYQEDAASAILQAWEQGETPLIALFTGAGKTTVFAEVLRRCCNPTHQRALVIAHTEELVNQPFKRISDQFNGKLSGYYGPSFAPGIGIVMGNRDDKRARIVVGSRQSLHPERLAEVLKYGAFDFILIDEAHHVYPGGEYWGIIKTVRAANPNVLLVGFTATPEREDGKALGAVFTCIPFQRNILWGIQHGYLVPPTRLIVSTGINLSGVARQAGDYNKKQLFGVLEAGNWADLAVEAYFKHIASQKRQALAFFPNVAMSRIFTEKMISAGIAAAHLDGKTDKRRSRPKILSEYQQRNIAIVSTVNTLTEGYDNPATSAILCCRPTQSKTVLTQMVGRGLRLHPGKNDCLFVDLACKDTRALQVGTLLGKMLKCGECQAEIYAGFKNCPECGMELKTIHRDEETDPDGPAIRLFSMANPDAGTDHGEDLVEELGSLFEELSSAWHQDGEYYSSAVGKEGALVIAPPTHIDDTRIARLRQRIAAGQEILSANAISAKRRPRLVHQIGQLQHDLYRADNYQLYYVAKDVVEHLRFDTDLISLMAEADLEGLKRAGKEGAKLTRKNELWRLEMVSSEQLYTLRSLGITLMGAERESLTKGEAAARITHAKAVPAVRRWIAADILPERKEFENATKSH